MIYWVFLEQVQGLWLKSQMDVTCLVWNMEAPVSAGLSWDMPFFDIYDSVWIDSPGESNLIWIHLYSYGLFCLLCVSLTTVLMHAVLMSAGNSVLVETNIIRQKSYQLQIQTKMKHFTTSGFTAVNQLALPEQLVWRCLTWAASQTGPVYF